VDLQLAANLDTTGAVVLLNGIAPGTAFYQRVGSKVQLKSVYIRANLSMQNATATGGVPPSPMRWLVVWDKQPNGTAPSWNDLIKSVTSAGANSNNLHDHLNLDQRDRFSVLADTFIQQGAVWNNTVAGTFDPAPSQAFADGMTIERYIRLRGLETVYMGVTDTIASVASGALWLFTRGEAGPAAVQSMTLTGCSRLRYFD